MVSSNEKTFLDIFKFLFFLVFFLFLFEFFIDIRFFIVKIVSLFVPFCKVNKYTFYCIDHIYVIVKECTGILSYSVLLAILFSDYKSININWILIGIFALFLWNIIRILLVIYLNGSELVHGTGWIISTILILIFVYFAYKKRNKINYSG